MPIEIKMPALSPTMTEGRLAKWLKPVGTPVKAGDVLAEIETDKATMEVESIDDGIVDSLMVTEGSAGIKVGTVIALLRAAGESVTALPVAPPPVSSGERIFATPLARRLAQQAGIDLTAVTGSGPHGRIIKADIDAALAHPHPQPIIAQAPAIPAPPPPIEQGRAALPSQERVAALAGGMPYRLQPHSGMRKVIARRLTESKQTVPHFYLSIDCDLDAVLQARLALNSRGDALHLSVNDFVIRAAALSLLKVPAANASWSDDGVLLWQSADIAVAVALEDGLITPIIKAAETKGLTRISTEMRDLGARARAGKLRLDEFQGGSFAISNLGMFGIRDFAAVISPPHGAILAIGAGEPRPVVRQGALAIATIMSCTLSVDHRAIDGAVAARFLQAFKGFIENPLTMLL